ncbi:MAG: HAD family hydrolase [Anaerolineae bacterium]|uniref:HAD family hydrolase n=1 Tax=Promineifilum sp. TaxID=2664178 RepID=UPI001DD892EF|nr:HAD family hydrolase [Anaerolineales bacterium]MCO5179626.1 HAD family hydrolase [Promineifilum sp.]MCW5846754.1 HAD family hydrolase [Anaerolineae bacterium]
MIRSLLLDLDDTLLGNEVDAFLSQYFGLIGDYARPFFDESTFLPMLIQATQAMIGDTNPELTNDLVFWSVFEELTGGTRANLEPFFRRFYETEFLNLKAFTVLRPAAAALVRAAIDQGLAVVVATNPLFPRIAIEHRLAWAGLPVSEFDFALVTAYENMHAAKPQPAYYREILNVVGVEAGQALMVGDDWLNDIVPAAEAGLLTYWIAPDDAVPADPSLLSGHGSLDKLADLVIGGRLQQLGA